MQERLFVPRGVELGQRVDGTFGLIDRGAGDMVTGDGGGEVLEDEARWLGDVHECGGHSDLHQRCELRVEAVLAFPDPRHLSDHPSARVGRRELHDHRGRCVRVGGVDADPCELSHEPLTRRDRLDIDRVDSDAECFGHPGGGDVIQRARRRGHRQKLDRLALPERTDVSNRRSTALNVASGPMYALSRAPSQPHPFQPLASGAICS